MSGNLAKLEEVDILDDTEKGKRGLDPLDTKMSYNNSYLKRYYKQIVLRQVELEVKKDFKFKSFNNWNWWFRMPIAFIFGQLWSRHNRNCR